MTKAISTNIIFILTVILGIFVLFWYILQVGALSQDIYFLYEYEMKLATLLEDNKSLDIDFSKMNSLSNIETYLARSDFIKPNYVKYIQLLEGSVAAK